MDRRIGWVLFNIVNVIATAGVALLWWWRGVAVREARRGDVPLASNRRQLRRNRVQALGQMIIAAEFTALGIYLIGTAIGWSGPVPFFILAGTAAFAAIFVQVAALAFWDWREMGEVGRLRERERQEGC